VLEDVEAGGSGAEGKVVLVCEDGDEGRGAERGAKFRIDYP